MLLVSARGQSIDTFPLWDGRTFAGLWGGSYATPSMGQTFTATASQNDLLSMTFSIEAQDPPPYNFQAYVFQWTGTGTTGGALFTSAVTAAPTTIGTYVPITINTGGLNLTPGQQYVALFSVNGLNAYGNGGDSYWAYLNADGYSGGNFVYNNTASLQGGWQNFGAGDLAFDLAFAVPEPSTISLACLGVLALASRLRRSGRQR